MSRRLLRPLLWTITLAPLCATPVSASSITCYGSIVLSTLGTEGMKTTIPDGVIVPLTTPASDLGAATVDSGNAGAIKSLAPIMGATSGRFSPTSGQNAPSAAQSAPSGASSSGSSGGATPSRSDSSAPTDSETPVVTSVDAPKPDVPNDEVPLPPVETKPSDADLFLGPPVMASDNTPPTVEAVDAVSSDTTNSPEPATLTLLGIAGVGGWLRARRRK